MKLTKGHLFLILLLTLILCCSLGVFGIVEGMENNSSSQNSTHGIKKENIPPGEEDLYILKSQIVPPSCPACPSINSSISNNGGIDGANGVGGGNVTGKCPPCPPCGRCPESAFECVKRPTYRADNTYLPVPVLADFSSFGM